MLDALFRFIYGEAKGVADKQAKREEFRRLDIPNDGRTFFYEHKGEIHERAIPADLRSHSVCSVDDFTEAFKRWSNLQIGVIWMDSSGLTLILDDACRRETVSLGLRSSVVFRKVLELHQGAASLDQRGFMQLLRREFRDAGGARDMLTAVSAIDFKRVESGNSTFSHGNESMGRSIEMEVTGAGDLPAGFKVQTNLWSNPGETDDVFTIEFDVEIDVDKQRFIVKPMPDQVDAAIEASLESIRTRLEEELGEVTILYGTP